jgi:hypothetical protein
VKVKVELPDKLKDGTAITHTAELLAIKQTADGAFAATAACCGKVGATICCSVCSGAGCQACGGSGSIKDEDTRSDHAIYDIASMTEDDLLKEVADHVQRVAQHHANTQKARAFLASLQDAG